MKFDARQPSASCGGLTGCTPVSVNGLLGDRRASKSFDVVVENSEFVSAEDVGARLLVDPIPDISDSAFQIGADRGIKLALRVAGNVDGSLVRQGSYAVNVGCAFAAHDVVGV